MNPSRSKHNYVWSETDSYMRTNRNIKSHFKNENVANVIELIFSRMTHPELKRKSWALWGAFYFYFTYENDFLKALQEFIKTDIYESMLEVILCVLLEKEIPPHIKDVEWPTYFKETSYYSIQNLTKQILDLENPIISSHISVYRRMV